MAADLLLETLLHTQGNEKRPGAAQVIYQRYQSRLHQLVEQQAGGDLSLPTSLYQVASGRLFGVGPMLAQAAAEFSALRIASEKPTVLVVGEIYVRTVPFANDFIIRKLQERGFRVRLAPAFEWLEYVDYLNAHSPAGEKLSNRLTRFVQALIRKQTCAAMHQALPPSCHTPIADALEVAAPFLRVELEGEAVVTLGAAIHEWEAQQIDGAVCVGPLECMPNKIAEAQFFHVAEQKGLPVLTVHLIGDPINPEILDNFAFEVHTRYNQKRNPEGLLHPSRQARPEPELLPV
jgi:hypothetical protein